VRSRRHKQKRGKRESSKVHRYLGQGSFIRTPRANIELKMDAESKSAKEGSKGDGVWFITN